MGTAERKTWEWVHRKRRQGIPGRKLGRDNRKRWEGITGRGGKGLQEGMGRNHRKGSQEEGERDHRKLGRDHRKRREGITGRGGKYHRKRREGITGRKLGRDHRKRR